MDPRIREDDGQGQSFLRPPVIPAPSCHSCTLLSFLRPPVIPAQAGIHPRPDHGVYADFLYGLGVYTLAHKTLKRVHRLSQAPEIGLISGYVRTIFQAVLSSGKAS